MIPWNSLKSTLEQDPEFRHGMPYLVRGVPWPFPVATGVEVEVGARGAAQPPPSKGVYLDVRKRSAVATAGDARRHP